jgi:hypothetical protein
MNVPRAICAAFVLSVGLAGTTNAAAALPSVAGTCRATILKSSTAYLTTETKALAKCWDGVAAGKAIGPCPDDRAESAIARAREKLDALIGKACGGHDKICGAGGAPDLALGVIGWNIGTCAGIGGAGCTNAITDCSDIAECVACVSDQAATTALDLDHQAGVPGADKQRRNCLRKLGKSTAVVFAALSASLGKCWLAVNRIESGGSFSCPDAQAAISGAKARATHLAGVCKACGSAPSCRGTDAFSPASLGFPAQCPAIGTCGGPVQTVHDMASCIACVSAFVADGAERNAIPAFTSGPPQCPM